MPIRSFLVCFLILYLSWIPTSATFNVTEYKDLPTNYEYYTSNGISSGLNADQPTFKLNGKDIFIYSGAMHYFRVPRKYWWDRLRKIRAAGLNTVETYVPWNLHEPQSGRFDFGNGGSDMEDFLLLEEFLTLAKQEDLFVIIRPGPFICAEFEFGGFPSWLLRDKNAELRTSNKNYMYYVSRYFNKLMAILAKYQFTKGGPIIALQVENEYAIGKGDKEYLKQLRQLMLNNGIVELLVTSDNPSKGLWGTIPELFFMTGNFDNDIQKNLETLHSYQPNRPTMVMEFWTGWFDQWGGNHTHKTPEYIRDAYEAILKFPASVNIYMFEGGTNFGFLNGAMDDNYKTDDNAGYYSIVTSYDYDSPLTESGDYTEKYYVIQQLLNKYNPVKTRLPAAPEQTKKIAYPKINIHSEIPFETLLATLSYQEDHNVVPMEDLNINNSSGQSYGYIVYKKVDLHFPANTVMKIQGRICDTMIVLVNGKRISPSLETSADLSKFGTWKNKDSSIVLTQTELWGATLELIVENWGRVNIGHYKQRKGLWQGNVLINNEVWHDWMIYPLEFKKSWTNGLSQWQPLNGDSSQPKLYRGTLDLKDEPSDTFINMERWTKGVVIVNGFVLGRYAKMGPQQTLYLPAPLLWKGRNQIMVFEHFTPANELSFSDHAVHNVTH